MRLGFPWRSDPLPPPPIEIESFEQTSHALEQVIARLDASPRCGVLDLGPPIVANLELYKHHEVEITVADFYRFFLPLRAVASDPSEDRPSRLFDELIPHSMSTHFDVVMAWDVLNYLSLDEIARLMKNLGRCCSPGAMMMAFISSQSKIPVSPSRYSIQEGETLRCEAFGPRTRPSPDYSEHALMSRMPNVTVESRLQLRNTMVEYLFSWR